MIGMKVNMILTAVNVDISMQQQYHFQVENVHYLMKAVDLDVIVNYSVKEMINLLWILE